MNLSKSGCVAALVALATLVSFSAAAQTARPGDRAVKDLIEQTGKAEKTFEHALDRSIKKSVVRSADGEMDVDAFLDDFKTSIERLEDRFDSKYAASSELNSVMRHASDMDKFIESQPPTLKGRSEWDAFKSTLNSLAGAYGTTFPADESSPPRRMNDLEIQQAADAAIKNGNNLEHELKSVFGKEDKDGIKAAEGDIEGMQKAAKNLKSRVDDGKPASGEAVAFVDAARKLETSLAGKTVAGDAKAANDAIVAAVAKVEQAFNIPPAT